MVSEILEQRDELYKQIRQMSETLNDEKTDFDSEEQERWDKLNADYDGLTRRYEVGKRVEDLGKVREQPAEHFEPAIEIPTDVVTENRNHQIQASVNAALAPEQRQKFAETRLRAWVKWNNFQTLTDDEHRSWGNQRIPPYFDVQWSRLPVPEKNQWGVRTRQTIHETRDLGVGTEPEIVPEGFINQLEESMLAFGGMRQVSTILRTATGNDLPWPTSNDTGNVGELVGEGAASAEADPTITAITFNAYKYGSKLIQISEELMQDSAFDLPSYVARLFAERIGRITNTHFTTGSGSGQPHGVVTATSSGITAAGVDSIAADELLDVEHDLDPAYRIPGQCFWMMEDATLAHIRKLKDGSGRYLFGAGNLQVGQPDSINGWPVVINQDMASLATGNVTVLFGNFTKYIIRDVAGMRFYQLNERYRELDLTGFLAFSRHDGDLLDAGTNPMTKLTQA